MNFFFQIQSLREVRRISDGVKHIIAIYSPLEGSTGRIIWEPGESAIWPGQSFSSLTTTVSGTKFQIYPNNHTAKWQPVMNSKALTVCSIMIAYMSIDFEEFFRNIVFYLKFAFFLPN